MKNARNGVRTFAIIVISLFSASCGKRALVEHGPAVPVGDVVEDGVALIGGYWFASSGGGDLFSVYDSNNVEVVPPGAVFTVIKSAYCIGYFGAGGYYYRGKEKVAVGKVFFILYPDREIEFHLPHIADDRFSGDRIPGPVFFDL